MVRRRWWWTHGARWRSHVTDDRHSWSAWRYHCGSATSTVNLRRSRTRWHSRRYTVKAHFMRVRWILYQIIGSVGRLILIVGRWLRIRGRWISLWKLHVRTRRWIRRLWMITSRLTRSCSTSCIAHPTTHWTDPTESRRTGSRLHYTRTSAVHFVAMHVW